MEHTSLVMKRLSLLTHALFTGTKSTEILYCFGHSVSIKTKDYAPGVFSFDILQDT